MLQINGVPWQENRYSDGPDFSHHIKYKILSKNLRLLHIMTFLIHFKTIPITEILKPLNFHLHIAGR